MHEEAPSNSRHWAKVRRWLSSWPATLLAMLLLWVAVSVWQARSVPKALPADWQGPALAGPALQQGSLRQWLQATQGQPRLLYFWASWCGICAASQSKTSALLKAYPMQTVAMQSGNIASVRSYLRERQLDWPVWVDEEGALAQTLGVGVVPAYLIIGPDNTVRYTSFGYTPEWGVRWRLWLANW